METLYKWLVQEKDKRGRVRWRSVRSPMTEDTARFWAANNNKVIRRVDTPGTSQQMPLPGSGIHTGASMKLR